MDRDDLELFERSLRNATERHTGEALDGALAELGWREALDDDDRAAVSLLFELQGRAGVTSTALDQLLLHALGVDVDAAVVLPSLSTWRAPGSPGDGVDGLALRTPDSVLIVAESG